MEIIENFLGDNKYKFYVKDNPEIFCIADIEHSPTRKSQIYRIKFYWENKYHGTKYAKDVDEVKLKANELLASMDDQVKKIKGFEEF